MEDKKIIDLYWERSEKAISETEHKYGKYCYAIAFHILHNQEDAKECVNDAYLKVWDAIPPLRPKNFSAFIGKITRNLSLNQYEYRRAKKRGSGETSIALDELQECIPSRSSIEQVVEDMVLTQILNDFLAGLQTEARMIFMRRYWYVSSVKEIADDYGISESKVKMSLLRSRNKLKRILEKEDIVL